MSDVIFVQMPFAEIERPSLAVGLLTSALRSAGIRTTALYGNIRFGEMIGLPAYLMFATASPQQLIGDWLFAESAFGSEAPPADSLKVDSIFGIQELIDLAVADGGYADLRDLLWQIRDRASVLVETLSQEIVERRPRVVACSSMFDQHLASLAVLQRVKQLDPDIFTIIGGANCAGPMGRATHAAFPAVDFTVTGEFDEYAGPFFNALVSAAGDATRVGPLPPGVFGPAHRSDRAANLPLAPPPAPPTVLADMDRAPVPDYDDYFEQLYSSSIGSYVTSALPFETSRGCWWGAKQHCTFCGLNAEGMAFRKKSPERALREIRGLTARYGIRRCFATDNIIDMSYFQTVLPELANDEGGYRIFYETKSNLKRSHVEALAAAGCYRIQPGIESLHDQTLVIMRKGATACVNLQLLKHCREFGVSPAWNLLCGFPGAKTEWLEEVAVDFVGLHHLPPPLSATAVRFDRFSPYHQKPEEYGLTLEPAPAYHRVYPPGRTDLMDQAYFFQDTSGIDRFGRHGRVIRQMVAQWQEAFRCARPPELVIETDDGNAIRIRDTRACAASTIHELSGAEAALIRALETPVMHQAVAERLRSMGYGSIGADACTELLAGLLERRLIWRSSTQYVALATPPLKRPISRDPPAGHLHIEGWLKQNARAVLA